ncbi:hypothetical protein AAVH_33666 [Aphelenchoides avenae]|nr:hypothetical protein AAVH_33666 [Aphelenchus avenae]
MSKSAKLVLDPGRCVRDAYFVCQGITLAMLRNNEWSSEELRDFWSAINKPLLDKDPEKISMTLENTYGGTWLVMLLAHDVAAGLKPENVIVDWNYLDVIAYAEHMIRGDFWVIIHRVHEDPKKEALPTNEPSTVPEDAPLSDVPTTSRHSDHHTQPETLPASEPSTEIEGAPLSNVPTTSRHSDHQNHMRRSLGTRFLRFLLRKRN